MSNVNENERDPQSPQEPPVPTPKGGGDISGKGISELPGEDEGGEDEGGGDEAGGDGVATDGGR